MADPLSLLRQYNVKKMEIIERDNQIILGEFSWNKNAKTNYIMWGSGKEGRDKEYYTLESLLFILKNSHLLHPVYVRQATAANLQVVRRPERKALLAYLNGETSTSASIDKSAPLENPIQPQVKREHGHDGAEPGGKMPRMDETLVLKGTPKDTSLTVDNIKSLPEVMPVEKIDEIKAKRLKRIAQKQRKQMRSQSDTLGVEVEGSGVKREKQ